MHRIALFSLVLGLALLSRCRETSSPDDPERLKKVLVAYFDGIRDKDFKKMAQATTDDFVLYEMGRVWNNDSVFKEMKRYPYTVVYTFSNFNVNMDAAYGHVTCYNHGDFLFDNTKQAFDWIESAAFKNTGAGWKMYFLHITERHQFSQQPTGNR
jgi:hypothetical protein